MKIVNPALATQSTVDSWLKSAGASGAASDIAAAAAQGATAPKNPPYTQADPKTKTSTESKAVDNQDAEKPSIVKQIIIAAVIVAVVVVIWFVVFKTGGKK